jgi:hypothetical protein
LDLAVRHNLLTERRASAAVGRDRRVIASVLVTCDADDVSSGSGGQRRRWAWTYGDHAPRVQRSGETFVGRWYSDDDRDLYKYIHVSVTDDRRFCPYIPFWSGFREPEFGYPSTFPRWGTLKEAIAYCETYLAKNEQDW